MSKIIGIGLGITSSCAAVMESGKPTVIANAGGVRITPSMVTFTKTGERLIGEPAKRQVVTNTDKTTSPIERHIGADYRADTDSKKYTPQKISTMTLRKLKADAETYLGETMTEAVVTVPIYFNDAQHQIIEDASKIANLDVKCIINEPTTTVLVYNLDNEREQRIMVCDLGGDTFDASIIEIGDDVTEVLSANGNTRLGGDDFDDVIIDWMIAEFKEAEGVDLSGDKMALRGLKEVAEKARKEVLTVTTTNINLPLATATSEGPKHLDINLTGAKFNELTHGLIKYTAIPVQSVLKDASITAPELDRVLLVGGPTRMIAAQEKVKQLTGKEPSKSLNPDRCVIIGAAIQDDELASDTGAKDILLLDVTLLSLSIETIGGVVARLVECNTTTLTKKSQIFSTAVDNQTVVNIHMIQGKRQFARDNKTLGQFRLDGVPFVRRRASQIEVIFDIGVNGIVDVPVKDLGTGKEQRIIVASGSNMSDDGINKVVERAVEYEAQDKKRKEAINARDDADSIVLRTERALEEAGDKISPNGKAEVGANLDSLKEAINRAPVEEMVDAQVEDIELGKEKLVNSAQKLFTEVYEQTQATGVADAGPDVGGAGTSSAPDDDVVDAGFREV